MIKISIYHLFSILVLILLYLIGKETNAILFWTVFYVVIETFILIKLIKSKYKSKIFLWLNILLFIIHFFAGLIMAYASLSMNVGSNSFIYQ